MSRRAYLELCLQQPITWLTECAANPSPHMTKRHIALIKIAIRRKVA